MVPKVIGAKPADKWLAFGIAHTKMQCLHTLMEEECLAEPVFIFPKFKDHRFDYMLERLCWWLITCSTWYTVEVFQF